MSGLASAIFLYGLRWFYEFWIDFPYCDFDSLIIAAGFSPIIMMVMSVAGFMLKQRVKSREKELEAVVANMKDEGITALKSLYDELLRQHVRTPEKN